MMKYLKKYGKETNLHKTKLYCFLEENKDIFEQAGYPFKIKTYEELFKYEVLYHSLSNKNKIDEAYNHFINTNYDVLDYLNYDEKRKMFDQDLKPILEQCHCFKEPESGQLVYLPHYDLDMNSRYINDYQMLTLKQYQEYIKQYSKDINKPYRLYQFYPFISSFSSLKPIGKDDHYAYFYYPESKRVYLFDQNDYQCIDELIFIDKYQDIDPSLEDVKEIVKIYLNEDVQSLVDTLYEKQWLSEKIYKKIKKKLK
ncbi:MULTISPECIES: hypothetical protein [Coprobacillaceae]|uniref:hypothetical protein n=1 Tax=Coprobacillaceae TaxID=2810280 RepID=UPI000E52AC96|nr:MULTISPECIES: hypothetical protein [Coprobacillaceae]RHM60115.1 hypothetical protein DWZ53_07615 [Coprobacillus sp. AF33-1AC]RHS92566.1 hypothetical protein DW911_08115 [Erysipelatoclostridium sp. AM42-17]